MRKNMNLVTLTQRELKESSAGGGATTGNCDCACWWAGTPGGSSEDANCTANHKDGLHSPDLNPTL